LHRGGSACESRLWLARHAAGRQPGEEEPGWLAGWLGGAQECRGHCNDSTTELVAAYLAMPAARAEVVLLLSLHPQPVKCGAQARAMQQALVGLWNVESLDVFAAAHKITALVALPHQRHLLLSLCLLLCFSLQRLLVVVDRKEWHERLQ